MPTLLRGGWASNGASFWMDGWIAISFAGKADDVPNSPIAHLASALPSLCGIPLPLLDSGGNALPIGWVLRAAFRYSVHDSQSCKADIVRLSGQKIFPDVAVLYLEARSWHRCLLLDAEYSCYPLSPQARTLATPVCVTTIAILNHRKERPIPLISVDTCLKGMRSERWLRNPSSRVPKSSWRQCCTL